MRDYPSDALSCAGKDLVSAGERPAAVAGPATAAFLENTCLPFLRNAQNDDGGWGFGSGRKSRVEPTCWALQALLNSGPEGAREETCRRGFEFLRATQLPDGSWPATPEQTTGCYLTSLACWVLLSERNSRKAVVAGLRWLLKDRPRKGALWLRIVDHVPFTLRISEQDDSIIGWGWTPRTAGWVEPTAITLVFLNQCPKELLPAEMARRHQSAEAMLYDRRCPGGGWNAGNPLVYGAVGDSLVIPTAWALLALRRHAQRQENLQSLDWLEKTLPEVRGPGSLALARICFAAYGRAWPAAAPCLEDVYGRNQFLENIPVIALVCLASTLRSEQIDSGLLNRFVGQRWLLADSMEGF